MTAVERFYRWLDTPWPCEVRAAEVDARRGMERYARRAAMTPAQRVRGRAACDLVLFACLAGILLVLALNQPEPVPAEPAAPRPASGPVVEV